MCADELDPDRLNNLYDIGIDEVSRKRQHNYLTLVADHGRGKIVRGTQGAREKAADRFFAELDPETAPQPADSVGPMPISKRASRLRAISLDMGHASFRRGEDDKGSRREPDHGRTGVDAEGRARVVTA